MEFFQEWSSYEKVLKQIASNYILESIKSLLFPQDIVEFGCFSSTKV